MADRNAGTVSIRLAVKDRAAVEKALKSIGKEGEQALRKIQKSGEPASRSLKAVSAASSELKGRAAGLNAQLGGISSTLSAIGPAGVAAGAALGAVVLTMTAISRAAVRAADSMAELGSAAQMAGLGVETYQEWEYAATRFGVSQDALVDGFKEMQMRAQEFAQRGAGTAKEAFEELGYTQDDIKQKLSNAPRLFAEIIDKVGELDKSAQLFSLDEIFGGQAGEHFIKLVNAGTGALTRMGAEGRSLGLVIDDAIVAKGADASKELKALQVVIDRNLNASFVSFAPLLVSMKEKFADFTLTVRMLTESFRALDEQSNFHLQGRINRNSSRLAELSRMIDETEQKMDSAPSGQAKNRARGALGRLRAERDALAKENDDIITEFKNRQTSRETAAVNLPGTRPADTSDVQRQRKQYLDGLNRSYLSATNQRVKLIEWERDEQLSALDAMQMSAEEKARAREQIEATAAAKIATAQEKINKSAGSGNSLMQEGQRVTEQMQTAAESYANTLERLNKLLQAGAIDQKTYERAVADAAKTFAAAEQEKLAASQSAGAGIKRGLDGYAEEAGKLGDQLESAVGGTFKNLEDVIVDFATTGELKVEDMLQSIAADFLRIMVRQTITGPLASLLSSSLSGMFGGGSAFDLSAFSFDSGGYTGSGGKHQPAGVVHKGEVVWSQGDVARAGGVAAVEAMRLGMRGYASGGEVWPKERSVGSSLAGGNSGNNSTTIQIVNQSSTPVSGSVEETTDSSGRRLTRLTLADAVGDALEQPGGKAKRYLKRAGVGRRGVLR
nr:phage tail tape measure C-terminal domain-containing protein [uncultured Cohaesibacter sp.]